MQVQVTENRESKPCGAIYLNDEILEEFKSLIGENRVNLIEVE